MLRDAALTPDDVLTLSELPAPAAEDALRPEDTRWLLVDHNVMTGSLGRAYGAGAGGRVVGCIDHHEDEGRLPRDADPRVVEKSGSCMSLVVEHCAPTWDGWAAAAHGAADGGGGGGGGGGGDGDGDGDGDIVDAHLARIALGPILVDTHNLRDGTKTTAHDERAVAYAEAKLKMASSTSSVLTSASASASSYDRAALFKNLSKLKNDLDPLSVRDILRKDYKEWSEGGGGGGEGEGEGGGPGATERPPPLTLGTSSVGRPVSFLVQKAGGEAQLVAELARWGEERGVDLVVVMTSFSRRDGGGGREHSREILAWARTGARAAAALRGFADSYTEALQLRTWEDGGLDADQGDGGDGGSDGWRRCWTQGKQESSRKQVAPMLREAMRRCLNA